MESYLAATIECLTSGEIPPPVKQDPSYVKPPRLEGKAGPRVIAQIEVLPGQLKHAYVGGFHIRCDESTDLGGDNSGPNPLSYFVAAAGFCLSTQIVQAAKMLKLEPRNVFVKVEGQFIREGSVIQGTAHTDCDSFQTDVRLDIDAAPEEVAQLLKMADASCFVMAALRDPVPLTTRYTVNGQPFEA